MLESLNIKISAVFWRKVPINVPIIKIGSNNFTKKKDYNPEYFGHFLIEFSSFKFRLTKLMVLHDFLCLTVINQIAFDQRDSIHFFDSRDGPLLLSASFQIGNLRRHHSCFTKFRNVICNLWYFVL